MHVTTTGIPTLTHQHGITLPGPHRGLFDSVPLSLSLISLRTKQSSGFAVGAAFNNNNITPHPPKKKKNIKEPPRNHASLGHPSIIIQPLILKNTLEICTENDKQVHESRGAFLERSD